MFFTPPKYVKPMKACQSEYQYSMLCKVHLASGKFKLYKLRKSEKSVNTLKKPSFTNLKTLQYLHPVYII